MIMRFVIFAASLTMLGGGVAVAEVSADLERCAALYGAAAIEPCTSAIESGTLQGGELGMALYNRGFCDAAKGEYDKAIADYTAAIGATPDDPEFILGRGLTYQNRGDLDEAIADYSEAIRLRPDWADA